MRSLFAIASVVMGALMAQPCAARAGSAAQDPYAKGDPDTHADASRSMRTHELPLDLAVVAIVPHSYTVNMQSVAQWSFSPVSWQTGGDWTQVLRKALIPYREIVVFIDKQARTVTLRRRGEPGSGAESEKAQAGPAQAQAGQADFASGAQALLASAPVAQPVAARATPAPQARPAPPPAAAGKASEVMAAPASVPAMPAPAAPLPSALPAAPEPTWQIRLEDRSLRVLFSRWAASAGWQLSWEVPVDYSIEATATLTGSLESAVTKVVGSLGKLDVPMKAIFYKGNKVLRVVAKGAE